MDEQLYAKYTVYKGAFGKHYARDEAYDFVVCGALTWRRHQQEEMP
jgi:hypothetical protein